MICNQQRLAEIFDVSTRTIQNWQGQGMPSEVEAGGRMGNEYNTAAVHQWLIDREIKEALKEKKRFVATGETYQGREVLDSDQELAYLRRWQARKAELETSLLEGKLLDAEEVMRVMLETDSKVKSAMLALPVRIAQIAVATPDRKKIEEACRAEVYIALQNLSERDGNEHSRDDYGDEDKQAMIDAQQIEANNQSQSQN